MLPLVLNNAFKPVAVDIIPEENAQEYFAWLYCNDHPNYNYYPYKEKSCDENNHRYWLQMQSLSVLLLLETFDAGLSKESMVTYTSIDEQQVTVSEVDYVRLVIGNFFDVHLKCLFEKQPAIIHQALKRSLENILFCIKTVSVEEKRVLFLDLCNGMIACAPGARDHLENMCYKLAAKNDLYQWLGELRVNIIDQLAFEHIKTKKIKSTDEIHVRIDFLHKINEVGYNIPVVNFQKIDQGDDLGKNEAKNVQPKDQFEKLAQAGDVTPEILKARFDKIYTDDFIVQFIAEKIEELTKSFYDKYAVAPDNQQAALYRAFCGKIEPLLNSNNLKISDLLNEDEKDGKTIFLVDQKLKGESLKELCRTWLVGEEIIANKYENECKVGKSDKNIPKKSEAVSMSGFKNTLFGRSNKSSENGNMVQNINTQNKLNNAAVLSRAGNITHFENSHDKSTVDVEKDIAEVVASFS